MDIIHHDVDFTNAMLFANYVMVMLDGKMIGGGLIEEFNETEVRIGRGTYLRRDVTFVLSPPPQCRINAT